MEKAKSALLANPKTQPELQQWQAFRQDAVTQFFKGIHSGVHAVRPQIDLRLNNCFRNPAEWGLNLQTLKPHLDSVRVCDYSEQTGNAAALEGKRRWLKEVRQGIGDRLPLLSAVAVRPKATPELIRQGVRIAVECGVNGITLGHHDGAEFPMLRAVREALETAKVRVPSMPAKAAR